MEEMRNEHNISFEVKRPLARAWCKWMDNIKMDIK
jgi:hypothetical protein